MSFMTISRYFTWLHIQELLDSVDHIEGLWYGELLQGMAIRGGDIGCGDTENGTVQVVKCCTCSAEIKAMNTSNEWMDG